MSIIKTPEFGFITALLVDFILVALSFTPIILLWAQIILWSLSGVILITLLVFVFIFYYKRPSILWEVEKWKKENNFEEFINRYKFVGRDEERRDLKAFMQNDKRIGLMVGEGGVGKTRLCIEFAEEIVKESKGKVYFINESQLLKVTSERLTRYIKKRNSLLILDDPKNVEQVLNFLKNLYLTIEAKTKKDFKTKSLLVLRPALGNTIETELKGDGKRLLVPTIFKIGRGDFRKFIKENFKILEKDQEKDNVIKKARSNFDSLIVLCEFHGEKSKLGDLYEVFDYKISKYVVEAAQIIGLGLNTNPIWKLFYLLALIRPIKLEEEKKHLEKLTLTWNLLQHLPKLINSKVEILSCGEPEGYSLISDTHAEFLLYKFIKEEKEFTKTWKRLLHLKPLNISLNIFNTRTFEEKVELDNVTILREIWKKLNSIIGVNTEYFQSILVYTGILSFLKFDCNNMNIDNWKETFRKIKKLEKENRYLLAGGLVNATYCYGENKQLIEMKEALQELLKLAEDHPTEKILEILASGLLNATKYFGENNQLIEMKEALKELRKLAKDHSTEKILEILAFGLFNATKYYGIYKQRDKMEEVLGELRKLAKDHSTEKILEKLASGLFNATYIYGENKQLIEMKEALQELRKLAKDHPTAKILEELAGGLFNATKYYSIGKQLIEMEKALKELWKLAKDHSTEKILEKLASGLFNATKYYGIHKQLIIMEEVLGELRKLAETHPTEKILEILAKGLTNATKYFGENNQLIKMEKALEELRKLAKDHSTEKILEELAKGLVNATYCYGEHGELLKHLLLLIELYNNRFYLEESLRKKAEPEIFFNVSEIVKEKYNNSGNAGLEELIKELKTQVREENDFIILHSNIEKYLSQELIAEIDRILLSLEKKK
ncbi:hypothetical protein ES705_09906 [subsurface metagenome]